MLYQLKTFTASTYYTHTDGNFELSPSHPQDTPLDQQIAEWLAETQNTLVHPGQLSMHTTWYGDKQEPYRVRCVTLGIAVLYTRGNNERADNQRSDDQRAVPFDESDS